MKRLTFHSLQSKITATFLIFIVTQLLIFSAITYWFDSRSIYREVANANLLTVEQMTNVLDTQMSIMENISAMLASNRMMIYALQNQVSKDETTLFTDNVGDELLQLMESTRDSWSQIDNIYLYDLQGNSIGVTEYEVVITNPDLKQFMTTDTLISYGTVLSDAEEKEFAVFSYFRLVKDFAGKPRGWIRMDHNLYNTPFFQKLYADERIYMVLEPNARVIYTNHPEKIDIVVISALLQEQAVKGNISDKYLEQESLISYNTSLTTGWITVLTVPQSLVNQGLIQVRTFAISFIVINVFLAAFGAFFISKRITKPLRTVFQTMKKIETGEFKAKIPVVSKDEIGELARRMNSMVENIDLLIQRVYKAELKNQEARFTALRAQINPHLLYNTLESMDTLALKEETWKLHLMIESLAIMLRYALRTRESVLLREEVKHVEAYLRIQQIKYANDLKIIMRIPEVDQDLRMPQLILQPIVENSFKYGFFHKDQLNVLMIYTERRGNQLNIHIVDNGVGADLEVLHHIMNPDIESNPSPANQIGLYNVHQRIRLYYGEDYGIQLNSRPGHWFKVTIAIPLESEGSDDENTNRDS